MIEAKVLFFFISDKLHLIIVIPFGIEVVYICVQHLTLQLKNI